MAGVPALSSRWVERELARLIGAAGPGAPKRVRLIRWEQRRGIAEVAHRDVASARAGWNTELAGPTGETVRFATRRSWGTLRKGKSWLRRHSAGPVPESSLPTVPTSR
ncbi:MAG TPA: hypothetical protein VGS18_05625 [Thermoplasmata archaeon]|nr:hypothetical protein [Thermoplasmata archaeon]